MSADGASQFFNRTGPIKLPHKQKVNATASQNQSQHVEDMFNAGDDVPAKQISTSNRQKKTNFSNTQPISSQGLQEGNKMLAQSRGGQQPGSRRELPNDKGMIQGS